MGDDQDDRLFLASEPEPSDIVMVRSKVAPVLLPVHKGFMPHHFSPTYNKIGMLAPPGLPPPVKSPLPYQTYLEVSLPQHYPFHAKDIHTKNTIATNAFIFLVEYIWSHDPTAVIPKFPSHYNDQIPAPPIAADSTRNREFPNTVKMVGYYLNNCRFHPSGAGGKVKIFLMHSVEIDTLIKNLNTKGSYQFAKAQIQAADIASTCWLLGTTEHTNCKDLTNALLNTPEFQARPEVRVLLRQKWVKLFYLERPSFVEQVFAVHVYTAKHHYQFVHDALQKLYNTSATNMEFTAQLPAYGRYYAVSDTTSYMASPPHPSRDLRGERNHQKAVLRQCTCLSKDLVGLVPYGGSALLRGQLLAQPESPDDVSTMLCVDRHPQRAFTYTFSWHQRYTPLAMAAIEKIVASLKAEKAARDESLSQSSSSHHSELDNSQQVMIPSTVLWHK